MGNHPPPTWNPTRGELDFLGSAIRLQGADQEKMFAPWHLFDCECRLELGQLEELLRLCLHWRQKPLKALKKAAFQRHFLGILTSSWRPLEITICCWRHLDFKQQIYLKPLREQYRLKILKKIIYIVQLFAEQPGALALSLRVMQRKPHRKLGLDAASSKTPPTGLEPVT